MTNKEVFESFAPEIREKLTANIPADLLEFMLSEDSNPLTKTAFLAGGFVWKESPEGNDYWYDVFRSL